MTWSPHCPQWKDNQSCLSCIATMVWPQAQLKREDCCELWKVPKGQQCDKNILSFTDPMSCPTAQTWPWWRCNCPAHASWMAVVELSHCFASVQASPHQGSQWEQHPSDGPRKNHLEIIGLNFARWDMSWFISDHPFPNQWCQILPCCRNGSWPPASHICFHRCHSNKRGCNNLCTENGKESRNVVGHQLCKLHTYSSSLST